MTNNWFLGVIWGVICVLLGIVAMMYPMASSVGVELFVAWCFIIMGIVIVVSAFMGDTTNGRFWTILLGILMVILGIVMLTHPMAGIMALSMVVAIFAFISGIVKFVAGWRIHDNKLKWLMILSGVASIILSILIFNNLILSLGILLAAELIVDGVALIVLGFSRRHGGISAH